MGLLSGLRGHASEIEIEEIEAEFNVLLIHGEYIEKAFKVLRDVLIFTNRRMILTDKQGVSGKKVQFHVIPYRSIAWYAIESAGRFDADAELCIWISGENEPLVFEFRRGEKILDVQLILAENCLL